MHENHTILNRAAYEGCDEEFEKNKKLMARVIAQELITIGAFRFDSKEGFQFASGMRSPIYIDGRMLMEHATSRSFVLAGLQLYATSSAFSEHTCVSGVATGGIAPAALLADLLGIEFVYVRSAAKDHGKKQRIEGGSVTGKRTFVVEDTVTTGGSSLKAIDVLRQEGARVETCLSLISYDFEQTKRHFIETGVSLYSLTTIPTILEVAHEVGALSKEEYKMACVWHEQAGRS